MRVLAAVLLLALAVPTAGAARTVARPDLVVSGGSVKVSASGKLTGRFVAANHGRARAGRSTAALSVRAAGRWRAVKRFALPRLGAHATKAITITATLPTGLPTGTLALRVCADSDQAVRERSNTNNCRTLGSAKVAPAPVPAPVPVPAPAPVPAPVPAPAPFSRPASSVPANPIAFTKGQIFKLADDQGGYWIFVPPSYDSTHATPTQLFVWMHGCGGQDQYDIDLVSPRGGANYIAISPDGREQDCWYPDLDVPKVLSAVADAKTHFNIDPRRVVVGGYSSGGDLAYRTAFDNAYTFAGVLAENSSPFRDTGHTQQQSLAAAYWKFNVVHLAHTEDSEYSIAGVRAETDALAAAGFPTQRIERPGNHYDVDAPQNAPTTGTDHDVMAYLLPHLADGWLAPP